MLEVSWDLGGLKSGYSGLRRIKKSSPWCKLILGLECSKHTNVYVIHKYTVGHRSSKIATEWEGGGGEEGDDESQGQW